MTISWIIYFLIVVLFGLAADLYFSLHVVDRKESMPWPTCPSCHQLFNPAWVQGDDPDPAGRCWWCVNGLTAPPEPPRSELDKDSEQEE